MTTCNPVMKHSIQEAVETRRETWTRTRLARRQIFSRPIFEGEVFRIRVVTGNLWVTFEGSRDDHHLGGGDSLRFRGPGLLVAEGIEEGAVLEISEGGINTGVPSGSSSG